MICFIKGILFGGFIVVVVTLLAVLLRDFNAKCELIREFDEQTSVERPEYPISVPTNSRPVLAPCDMEK